MLGLLTMLLGLLLGSDLLIILACSNICGAAGDILMSIFIMKLPEDMEYIEDNKNRFVIVTGEDISVRKAYGIKFEEIEDDFGKIAPIRSKKFEISKWSYIIFGLLCLYTVVVMLL